MPPVLRDWIRRGAVLLSALCFAGAALAQTPAAVAAPLSVERIRASAPRPLPHGDGILTLVRVDLRHYRLRFLTEERHGPRRSATRWLRDEHLAGVTNAGMFLPNGRSVGHMVQDGTVASRRRVSRYRGTLAFGPRRAGIAALEIGGGPRGRAGCGRNLDAFLPDYANVLQAYSLLDCQGRAVPWRNRMRYSVAGLGVDAQGRAVFFHSRTPYRMETVSRMLAEPSLGLRGMIYLEGGPEASLVVEHGGVRVREVGSYEDGFNENDDNHGFWDLPNIVAFEARSP